MSTNEITVADLRRILLEAGGDDEDATLLDDDVIDIPFVDLGYDSLTLLEAGGRIENEWNTRLEDSTVFDSKTPRALLAAVNQQLAAAA